MSAHVFLKLLSYRKGINAKLADQFFCNKQQRTMNVRFYFRDHTCFSCINICRVPRMLFEYEANRLSVQTSSE